MIPARSIARSIADQFAWRRWVLAYRVEQARQSARRTAKRTIMACVAAACAVGEWLISALGLEDA